MVIINHEEITQLAFKIYCDNWPLDDVIWQLAEVSLFILKNFKVKADTMIQELIATSTIDELKPLVQNQKIIRPSKDEITDLAQRIYYQNNERSKLHWFLAEKLLLWKQVKELLPHP